MIQLLALFSFCILLMAKIKPRGARYALRIMLASFCALQVFSYCMTESPIGYQFYNHLDPETFRIALGSFPLLVILGLAGFIALVWFFTRLSRLKWILKLTLSKRKYFPILILLILIMSLPGGILNSLYKIIDGRLAAEINQETAEAFRGLGLDHTKYVFKKDLLAEPGKNIIVISVESFERGILDRGDLAPELVELSKRWTYFPKLKASVGAPATVSSLYAWQTGMPQYFGQRATVLFSNAVSTELVGLGDILQKAGYNSVYILGEPDFAGTRCFLELYGYKVLGDYNDFPFPVTKAGSFGPYDADILELAKVEYKKLKQQNKPFFMGISTVDTHFPGSRIKPELAEKIPPHKDMRVKAINGTSYAINDFIKFLADDGALENTVIYIMPDHLIPQSVNVMLMEMEIKNRGLFLLTNAKTEDMAIKPDSEFYQYQLPQIFLNGAGIKTNAVFLNQMLSQALDDKFLDANNKNFIKLNQSLWVFSGEESGVKNSSSNK